jgi:hypothetical protein
VQLKLPCPTTVVVSIRALPFAGIAGFLHLHSPGSRACKHAKYSEVLCFGAQPSFSFLLPHFWKLKFLAKIRFFSEEPVVQHIYSYLPYKDQGSEDNISQQNFMTVGNFFQCLHLQNCRIPYTSSIQSVMSAYPIPF